jgi:hypothetical protein
MKNIRYPIVLVFLMLLSLPICAYADAGTPLMWVGFLHLTIGNLLIGIAEGLLLAWIFKLKCWKCILYLVGANYFSAFAGLIIIRAFTHHQTLDIYNVWQFLVKMVFFTYGCTLLLEWPFFALCFRGASHWFRKSVVASLIIQTASYLLLFSWYLNAMDRTLHREVNIVPASQIAVPQGVEMYYISENDGGVYCRDFIGNKARKICDLPSRDQHYHYQLNARLSESQNGKIDIYADLSWEWSYRPQYANPVQKDVACTTTLEQSRANQPILRLGEVQHSSWEFRYSDFSGGGIYGKTAQGNTIQFAFETPFCSWLVRHPVQLPGDMVLFQLGERQICIFDAPHRKIAVIAYGNGPLAVIPNKK